MPIRLDEMETSNNREAEGASFTRRSVDMSEAFMPDPIEMEDEGADEQDEAPIADDGGFPLTEDQLTRLVRSAFSQGKSYQEQVLQPRWTSAYAAFNNKHSSDSKYSSARFRGRSRLFRPKTRSTARKKQAEAAAALFATSDALIVRATDETNEQQVAGAELLSALIRFRLDRSNENSGVPWFQIAMGAHLSAQQTSVCISKQYWEYRRELEGYDEVPIEAPVPLELQPFVGAATYQVGTRQEPRYRIVRDRPRVELMPPEDVIRDPTASWEDQAQDSAYLILRFPMTVEAGKTFVRKGQEKSRVRFYDITDAQFAAAAGKSTDPNNAASVRRARENNGTDRYSDFTVDEAYSQIYLHENYLRIEGKDYVFWTLGVDRLISDVIPVEEAYPEQGGARPVVIGVGALEPFKIDPMSPIESWQPLQLEMNDLANLRLDTLKQTIAPLAKVRRGRSVDIRAIQNRSPDTVVYMQDMADVEFDRPGSVAGEAYVEMEKLNADFDDQAGNFSTGSVQTNRQLGETVGGMQMMMSNANALGEFDLRVWIETWVEPVLRQLVKLEQFYETDANVLAISAKRAKLMPRFGISHITDDLLNSQVAISVDVGIGSSDPLISLQKFEKASQIVLGLLGPAAQARMKQDAVIDEVYGKAGYKDAAERFFNPAEEEDQRIIEMQQALQQMQQALMEAQKALEDKRGDQMTRIQVARITTLGGLAKTEMTTNAQKEQTFINAATDQVAAEGDRQFQREQGATDREFQMQQGEAQHARSMQMEAAKQTPGSGGSPGGGAGEGMGGSIHELLGLQPPQDPAQTIQPLVQAMMMGFRMLMQQSQQQNAAMLEQLSAQQQDVVGAILQSQEESNRQNMLMTRQIVVQQQATLEAVQQGNQQVVAAMSAPRRIVRDPNTGFAAATVIQMPQQTQTQE
ncbi:MAG: hypothetical protein ABFD96_06040 [Armatimonadia bacterium]